MHELPNAAAEKLQVPLADGDDMLNIVWKDISKDLAHGGQSQDDEICECPVSG